MKKVLLLLICCISFSACDNGELERLRQENASLKAQIAELSETEQNRFNKAVDLFNTANDLQSYRLAEETFDSFIEKFPASSYLESAKQHKQQAKSKADNIEKVANTKADITSLIAQRKWGAATSKVNSIKDLIGKEEYSALLKQINDEKYKPRKLSIDQLVSELQDISSNRVYGGKYWERWWNIVMHGERVEVVGYSNYNGANVRFKNIDLHSKPGCVNGSDISIHYEKTNKVNTFMNMNWQNVPCGTGWKVVGKAFLLESGTPYIEAETIERL